MNKLFIIVFLLGLNLISCNKKETDFTAVGDVYLVSQKIGQDTLYGISIHAYSFAEFESVSVVPNENEENTIHLGPYSGFNTDFYYDTPENELSIELPATGNYHFTATLKDGDVVEFDDVLYDDVLLPPQITKCEFDEQQSKAVVEWVSVEGADLYVIKLFKNADLVFLSPAIDASYNSVTFNEDYDGWGTNYTPEDGVSYTMRLSAFKFETVEDDYNVQASTSFDHGLKWGN